VETRLYCPNSCIPTDLHDAVNSNPIVRAEFGRYSPDNTILNGHAFEIHSEPDILSSLVAKNASVLTGEYKADVSLGEVEALNGSDFNLVLR